MIKIFMLGIRDFFLPQVLTRLLVPYLISFIVVITAGAGLVEWLTSGAVAVDGETYSAKSISAALEQSVGAIPLIGGALVWLIHALLVVMFSVAGFFLGTYVIVLLSMFITGFLTPGLVKAIHKQRYPEQELNGFDGMFSSNWRMFSIVLKHFALFLICAPLLLIPIFNAVVLSLLFYSLFRTFMVYDVASNLTTEAEYDRLKPWRNLKLTSLSGFLYGLTLVPFLNIAVPVFAVVVIAHYFFLEPEQTEEA